MDILGQVVAGLIVTAIVALVAYLWNRKLRQSAQAVEVPAPRPPAGPSINQKRAGIRLANNASAILTDLRYLAEQTKSPDDFWERKENVERWLREFTDDVKPYLPDLGDLEGEERARRVYGDLAAEVVPLLNMRPAFIIVGDGEPVPGWVEQYIPIREGLERHLKPVAEVLAWAQGRQGN